MWIIGQTVREIKRKGSYQSIIWFELFLWLHYSFIWQVFCLFVCFLSIILVFSGWLNKILFLPVLEAGKFKINSAPGGESHFGSPPPS